MSCLENVPTVVNPVTGIIDQLNICCTVLTLLETVQASTDGFVAAGGAVSRDTTL